MKLSKIVLSAVMLLGVTAHADMASEFNRAHQVASRKAEASYNQQSEEQARKEQQQQLSEVKQALQDKGIDVRNTRIEFGRSDIGLCVAGRPDQCGPSVDIYFAKTGNIICEVTIKSASFFSKKSASANCYDSTNPQPNEAYQPLEVIPW